MTIEVEQPNQTSGERLHWSLETRGRSHILDLLPAVSRGSVSIELDGHAVAQLPKPTPQRPWQKATITVDAETFVVGLTWQSPVVRTDVFASGRSLADGRTIEQVREAAPPPLSNYEVWIGGMMRAFRIPPGSILPRWMGIVSLISIVGLALIIYWRVTDRIVGVLAAAAMLSLFLIWFRSWVIVMDRTHRYLLRRPELGDGGRLLVFFGALLGYVVAAIVVVVLFVVLIP